MARRDRPLRFAFWTAFHIAVGRGVGCLRDDVEMIRMLESARDSAVKARTQAANQREALVVTAPSELRETLNGLTTSTLAKRCRDFRLSRLYDRKTAAKFPLPSLARRYRQLSDEVCGPESEI